MNMNLAIWIAWLLAITLMGIMSPAWFSIILTLLMVFYAVFIVTELIMRLVFYLRYKG